MSFQVTFHLGESSWWVIWRLWAFGDGNILYWVMDCQLSHRNYAICESCSSSSNKSELFYIKILGVFSWCGHKAVKRHDTYTHFIDYNFKAEDSYFFFEFWSSSTSYFLLQYLLLYFMLLNFILIIHNPKETFIGDKVLQSSLKLLPVK